MPVSRKLVIVESPAKAHAIEKFLGRNYKVEASQGHVRDLPKSRIGISPDDSFRMDYITIHGKGDLLAKLRKEAKGAKDIYLATDPDREGEAISWHLAQALKLDPTEVKRIEFHEITKKAVTEAVKNPRRIDMDLVDAQQARRALDRLVGYKISPLLWAKVRKGLSAGRVQSVATRMIVDREEEIEAFVPEEYWDIYAGITVACEGGKALPLRAKLSQIDGKRAAVATAEEAKAAQELIKNAKLTIQSIKTKERFKHPAAPFTTSTLQQEASRKLNFTIAKTMQVVQGLYEGVDLGKEGAQGLVSYIRTDSVRVSDEALAAARAAIGDQYGENFLPAEANVYKGRSSAQDAHEAIRPTDAARTPDSIKQYLSNDQYKLYKLIYSRFIASQMADARFDTVTLEIGDGTVLLRYYGEHKVFAGFTAVYEEGSDEIDEKIDSKLPRCEEGSPAALKEISPEQHFTQPPSRYTEASLVKELEELGIGRPSTYAPTVSTIIARGYVSREKKRLYPTELGRMVTGLMIDYFDSIVDTAFTAQMENELDSVEAGDKQWRDVLKEFYPDFEKKLERAENDIEKIVIEDEKSDVICDKCGATMVYKNGRFGRFLACPSFPECRNTQPILTYIGVKCPDCGGEILEKTSKKNRKFYGCEKYPECQFVSWEMPVAKPCPECGHYMTIKRRKNDTLLLCSNEACRHHEPFEEEGNEND
ncbi:MAG: type I DNA topoisomerase [Clostridiales bacterium]|nr:type I DNA topoisomerase [Clostridiales bacterium]